MSDTVDAYNYRDEMDRLRQANDALFYIDSYRQDNTWVRDATHAYALKDFPEVESPLIDKNNALMRCLSMLRAVDYAIQHCGVSDAPQLRQTLKQVYDALKEENPPDEAQFNTHLIEALHAANLTEGCTTKKDAEKLLFRYRVLSSVLDPALTLVTLTYDEDAKILQREVQVPVTEKLPQQKEAIEALRTIEPHPVDDEKNAHTTANLAGQRVDALFADLLEKDDRMLPAHARKTHAVGGARNAFVVKVETVFDTEIIARDLTEPLPTNTNPLWLVRMGVPVFVGKGEPKENIHQYTNDTLTQIRKTAMDTANSSGLDGNEPFKLHLTVLNTNIPHQHQDEMLTGLREGIARQVVRDELSNVAVNDVGTAFQSIGLSETLSTRFESEGRMPWLQGTPGQKADRLDRAVDVLLTANDAGFISCVNCASGQDRTGTVVEKAIQKRTYERWCEHTGNQEDETRIQTMRARGFNAAEVASHMMQGSPGMKRESRSNNLLDSSRAFGEAAERVLYRRSADTNTKNPVYPSVREILHTSSKTADEQFLDELVALNDACRITYRPEGSRPADCPMLRDVKHAGQALLETFQPQSEARFDSEEAKKDRGYAIERALEIATQWVSKKTEGVTQLFLGKQGKENAQELAEMTQALRYARESIEAFKAGEYETVDRHLHHIKLVRKKLPGRKSLVKQLGAFAVVLTIAALAALLVISQPFGLLMLAGAGALGAVLMMSSSAFLGFGARSILKMAKTLFFAGQERGHAGAMRDFKTAIKEKKIEAEKQGKGEEPSDDTLEAGEHRTPRSRDT